MRLHQEACKESDRLTLSFDFQNNWSIIPKQLQHSIVSGSTYVHLLPFQDLSCDSNNVSKCRLKYRCPKQEFRCDIWIGFLTICCFSHFHSIWLFFCLSSFVSFGFVCDKQVYFFFLLGAGFWFPSLLGENFSSPFLALRLNVKSVIFAGQLQFSSHPFSIIHLLTRICILIRKPPPESIKVTTIGSILSFNNLFLLLSKYCKPLAISLGKREH